MSEKRWTPGPWEVEPTIPSHGWEGYEISASTDLGRTVIAEACGPQYGEHKCNAHLIAAAPELYEALNVLVDVCTDGHYPFDETSEWSHPDLERARAALAKARGESL